MKVSVGYRHGEAEARSLVHERDLPNFAPLANRIPALAGSFLGRALLRR
jgi:hypothetical protein